MISQGGGGADLAERADRAVSGIRARDAWGGDNAPEPGFPLPERIRHLAGAAVAPARVDRRVAVARMRGGPDHAVPIAAISFVPLVDPSRLPRAGQGQMTYSSSLCLDDAARRLRRRERALTHRPRHSDALTYGPRHGERPHDRARPAHRGQPPVAGGASVASVASVASAASVKNAAHLLIVDVAQVPLRPDGAALCVRRRPDTALGPGQLTVLGGRLEAGEPLDHAARSAGGGGGPVSADQQAFRGLIHHHTPTGGPDRVTAVFVARSWGGEPHNAEPRQHQHQHQHQHEGPFWVPTGRPSPDHPPYTVTIFQTLIHGPSYRAVNRPAGGAR
ncbi:hypothetical protein [Streptomyces sp. NRRL S-1521]|uniref:hypothetical protein n=1 Tax=Streptomyces sp. NRRL S-1521 TaxID=1609100 RepID=UPI000A71285E|nr:hypothetical protein [Streptomyces sp. NRRL S-1521]